MVQKIVVYLTTAPSDAVVTEYGIRLAVIFGKELCLFFNGARREHGLDIDAKLVRHREEIRTRLPGLPVSVLVGAYRDEQLAVRLADEQEAILLLADPGSFRKLAPALRESPIPFLFAGASRTGLSDFKKVVFPVDLRPRNSEAIKWILYFGKYNQSEIIAVGANDRYASNRQLVGRNLALLKKMLQRYGVGHRIVRGTQNSLGINRESLHAARETGAGMLVLLGSSAITFLDYLLGLPEAKIVSEARGLPVLIVNPRRETYLVCE